MPAIGQREAVRHHGVGGHRHWTGRAPAYHDKQGWPERHGHLIIVPKKAKKQSKRDRIRDRYVAFLVNIEIDNLKKTAKVHPKNILDQLLDRDRIPCPRERQGAHQEPQNSGAPGFLLFAGVLQLLDTLQAGAIRMDREGHAHGHARLLRHPLDVHRRRGQALITWAASAGTRAGPHGRRMLVRRGAALAEQPPPDGQRFAGPLPPGLPGFGMFLDAPCTQRPQSTEKDAGLWPCMCEVYYIGTDLIIWWQQIPNLTIP